MKEYIKRVKEELTCNATENYKSKYITYIYSNSQIDNNLDYFKQCKEDGLSPYKALLFFDDYLSVKDLEEIREDLIVAMKHADKILLGFAINKLDTYIHKQKLKL